MQFFLRFFCEIICRTDLQPYVCSTKMKQDMKTQATIQAKDFRNQFHDLNMSAARMPFIFGVNTVNDECDFPATPGELLNAYGYLIQGMNWHVNNTSKVLSDAFVFQLEVCLNVDEKAENKAMHLGPDGKLHCSFMVVAASLPQLVKKAVNEFDKNVFIIGAESQANVADLKASREFHHQFLNRKS